MDGVLCRNMPAHIEAWRLFFRRYGVTFTLHDFLANTMGRPTHEVLGYYFKRTVPPSEARTLAAIKESLYRRIYRPNLRAANGLRRFLENAQAQGYRIGLGTGSKQDNVSFIIDGLDLRGYFDAIVDGSMVAKGKPDPETYRLLARALEIRPKDCVVFEDSLLGEEAAHRAGMHVVAITTSHRPDEFKHAKITARDFSRLSPTQAVELLC